MKIDISVRGKWLRVPAFTFGDKTIVIRGKWIRTARVHDEAWIDSELTEPERCLREMNVQKCKADLFTFAQMPPARLAEYQFPYETDSIAIVRLNDFDRWWMSLPQETRKNVRRSEKRNVRVEIKQFNDQLVHELTALNSSSAIRQGRRYTHYGKTFDEVKRDHSSFLDRSEFLCAYHENELIGFIKLVYRGKIASILNILSDDKHRDRRPANALMKAAVERCFQKGLTHLTYGYFHYGNKRDTTITEFKVRHGFEEELVLRYFVPLTIRGKLWFALKLHRGLLGLLPSDVLNKGVELRAKWYQFVGFIKRRCSSAVERSNRIRQMGRSIPPAGSNS